MPRPAAKPSKSARVVPAAKQLDGFLARFEPGMARRIRACRAALRKRLPAANELVWDNYNFFVIGYCTSLRPSSCIVSLAANAKGVGLSFYHGSKLPDPSGILLGSGSQNRFVRLESAGTLAVPAVAALIRAAVAITDPPLPARGRGTLVVRSVSAKKRPRRDA